MAVGADASGYWSEIEDAMTEHRSEQNLAGNVSQRDGVELHKGAHWDQLMIVTPDYQDESCDELYRQTPLAWEGAADSGELGRNGGPAGMGDTQIGVTPEARIVVRYDGLCELAHIVM